MTANEAVVPLPLGGDDTDALLHICEMFNVVGNEEGLIGVVDRNDDDEGAEDGLTLGLKDGA